MNKKMARIRRAARTRCILKRLGAIRLVVHRTPRHIYAQIIASNNAMVLASVSTVEKFISKQVKNTGNKNAATIIGAEIAKRALDQGIKNVSFDRSGFLYHGRVQALAEAARQSGLQF